MNINFPLDYLGDSADKHTAKIEALEAAHGKHADAINKHARVANACNHSRLRWQAPRLCEKLLGDSADKQAAELQALKDAHNSTRRTSRR